MGNDTVAVINLPPNECQHCTVRDTRHELYHNLKRSVYFKPADISIFRNILRIDLISIRKVAISHAKNSKPQ